jgi:pimeloyl-ACP methyl ester carboxylesterase
MNQLPSDARRPDDATGRPSTFVLLPGAGGDAGWYWHRVVPLLQGEGHEVIAVDLPGADPAAGLPEYARVVIDAIGDRKDVVLVAQSLGGFTAPLVAAQVPVRAVVLVNPMIPVPGETAGAWWGNTGSSQAFTAAAEAGGYATEFDSTTHFLHDIPAEVIATAPPPGDETDASFETPCDFAAWPEVPIRVVAGSDDRLFPVAFQQKVARDRLGIEPDVLPGGHLIAVSRPAELAAYLLAVLSPCPPLSPV